MLKIGFGLIILTLFFSSAFAQKADSLKADTNLLNRYRIDPRKNAFPIRIRPIQITEEQIPVELLDYKVELLAAKALRHCFFGFEFS